MALTRIGSIGINTDITLGGISTFSADGVDITGIVTATSFVGSGSGLTGVASTDDIRTNTNATFLQNINVSGSTTTVSVTVNGTSEYPVKISKGDSSAAYLQFINSTTGSSTSDGFRVGMDSNEDGLLSLRETGNVKFATDNTERARIEPKGNIKFTNNLNVVGTVTATSYAGDGSGLTGLAVGVTTEAASISGITTYLDLTKDDHELVVTGNNTISVIGGSQGTSHTLRLQNSGISTVTLDSTYFKFPSGGTPNFPTADGSISLISFTVHKAGAVGVNTVLLAGASVNFS